MLGACSTGPEFDVVGVWELETVATNGVFIPMPESVTSGEIPTPALVIGEDERLSFSGICNTMGGEAEYGDRLRTEDLFQSIVGCMPDDDQGFEDLIFDVVNQQPRIEFGTEQAMQLQGEITTLTFRRQP